MNDGWQLRLDSNHNQFYELCICHLSDWITPWLVTSGPIVVLIVSIVDWVDLTAPYTPSVPLSHIPVVKFDDENNHSKPQHFTQVDLGSSRQVDTSDKSRTNPTWNYLKMNQSCRNCYNSDKTHIKLHFFL